MLTISRRPLRKALATTTAVVALCGLGAEIVHYAGAGSESPLIPLLSLSEEANLPTWYSSMLLLSCGLLLGAIGLGARRAGAPFHRRWCLLGAVFVYMSIDEAAQLHEHLGGLMHLHGVLFYSWVVPAAVVVLGLGLAYVPFIRGLPPPARRRFVIAGALYVGGALGMELPLGWWAERAGDHNLVYALIDFVEETLEMAGATLFLLALVDHLARLHPELRFEPAGEP